MQVLSHPSAPVLLRRRRILHARPGPREHGHGHGHGHKQRPRAPPPPHPSLNAPPVPRNLFQTWHTKDLPPAMRQRVDRLKETHPEFTHHLFDDADCRAFLKQHFAADVVRAYDDLVPGAYKADLWRYCVLFVHGGIYLDIKLECLGDFRLTELTDCPHFVRDRLPPLTVYNALIASPPRNPLLWRAIRQVVANVQRRFYGGDPLEPTGPRMLGNLLLHARLRANLDLQHHPAGGCILYRGKPVLSTDYAEYSKERAALPVRRYDLLWQERKVYR